MSSEKTDLELPTLDLNTSLNVLIQGCQLGQKAGIFSFQDAASIYQAIFSIQQMSKRADQEAKEAREAKDIKEI